MLILLLVGLANFSDFVKSPLVVLKFDVALYDVDVRRFQKSANLLHVLRANSVVAVQASHCFGKPNQ